MSNKNEYLENKAIEIRDKIQDAKISNKRFTLEMMDEIIYEGLKEVAERQKFAIYDAFNHDSNYGAGIILIDYIQQVIQDSKIGL
jgi:hypothetical protein